jgi:hypothetical protein
MLSNWRSAFGGICDGVSGTLEDKAVDMTLRFDNARALPTYPQPPQQERAA